MAAVAVRLVTTELLFRLLTIADPDDDKRLFIEFEVLLVVAEGATAAGAAVDVACCVVELDVVVDDVVELVLGMMMTKGIILLRVKHLSGT